MVIDNKFFGLGGNAITLVREDYIGNINVLNGGKVFDSINEIRSNKE